MRLLLDPGPAGVKRPAFVHSPLESSASTPLSTGQEYFLVWAAVTSYLRQAVYGRSSFYSSGAWKSQVWVPTRVVVFSWVLLPVVHVVVLQKNKMVP